MPVKMGVPPHTIDWAIKLAVEQHWGQVDKVGQPYILHALRVMFAGKNEDEQIVGVLHDVVEDCGETGKQAILNNSYLSDKQRKAIFVITRNDGERYEDYIARVCGNNLAAYVKVNDLNDNLSRICNLSEPTKSWLLQRYRWAKSEILVKMVRRIS
jgi:hypothetical protein